MSDGSGGSNPHIHTSPETRALELGVLQRRGASPHAKTIRPNGFCMILSYTIHVHVFGDICHDISECF